METQLELGLKMEQSNKPSKEILSSFFGTGKALGEYLAICKKYLTLKDALNELNEKFDYRIYSMLDSRNICYRFREKEN